MRYGQVRGRAEDIAEFAAQAEPAGRAAAARPSAPRRIEINPNDVERGLSQLVLSVVELLRRLVEKQAIRRIEGGSLRADEIERVGVTLMRLEAQMDELKRHFDVDSLDLDLGPLGHLLDD